MGCGEFLVKYILFFANLFFALAGIALLGLGVAVELKWSQAADFLDNSPIVQLTPIGAIVIGCIVFVVAFFGCCGAIRESNCMLITYAIFMIVLMVLKITLATLIFVKQDALLADIPKWLGDAFTKDKQAFQQIERTFECCGVSGPESYLSLTLPDSCCAGTPCTIVNAHPGCTKVVGDFLQTFGLAIGAVAIVIVAVELVAVVFGLCLANHARNKSRRTRY
ncbi:23 kDa integral membrane protein-like [Pararge aegeria]|uniref:Tetraspanin n=2 Tax=Pararge aegeria TaxID=116150 RepID=A0A8S4S0D8_9NEOP|nr:23 kDa integral membrane protein-like [Pararge aegeria]CAH2243628.1 jg23553 [Pararge aegeria aegeria]